MPRVYGGIGKFSGVLPTKAAQNPENGGGGGGDRQAFKT